MGHYRTHAPQQLNSLSSGNPPLNLAEVMTALHICFSCPQWNRSSIQSLIEVRDSIAWPWPRAEHQEIRYGGLANCFQVRTRMPSAQTNVAASLSSVRPGAKAIWN